MAHHRLDVDLAQTLLESPRNCHNRWHPAIAPVLHVAPGDTVTCVCRDAFDQQIRDGDGGDAVSRVVLGREHPLTGPIYVEGAEPGDVLEVELLEFVPAEYAFSLTFPGFSLLGERFPDARVSHWRVADGVATSDDFPGIALRGEPFLGIAGVAPSLEHVDEWARREGVLADQGLPVFVPTVDYAVPDSPEIATTALRTMPPRENGGNMDVPWFGVGSTMLFRCEVEGGLLSVGDPHFLQGDGEVGGSAIEMSAVVTVRVGLRKARDCEWRPTVPAGTVRLSSQPERSWLITNGIPVEPDGVNRDRDLLLAMKQAVGEMIDRLQAERGLADWQALTMVSVAAKVHISLAVVSPNAVVTVAVPTDIFVDDARR